MMTLHMLLHLILSIIPLLDHRSSTSFPNPYPLLPVANMSSSFSHHPSLSVMYVLFISPTTPFKAAVELG